MDYSSYYRRIKNVFAAEQCETPFPPELTAFLCQVR